MVINPSNNVPRALEPAAPAAEAAPSVLQNLAATNEAMLGKIAQDVVDIVHHPLDSLVSMIDNAVSPFRHPIEAVKKALAGIEEDHLGGTIDAVASATGVAYIGTILLAGAAVLAAPLTGGASLAVAAVAFGASDVLGVICLGTDAAGLVVHEARGAMANTEAEAKEEGQSAASFLEDGVLTAGVWAAGNALEGMVPEHMKGAKAVAGLTNTAAGVTGVYDAVKPAMRAKPAVHAKPGNHMIGMVPPEHLGSSEGIPRPRTQPPTP